MVVSPLRQAALMMCVGLALAACALPRSGPSRAEILASDKMAGVHVVEVTPTVAQTAQAINPLGFDSNFLKAGTLASIGQKVTLLQEIQVDQNGLIFMPFAGRLLARGKTPEELRRLLTERLREQTPDPQVEVRRLAGDGATVSVMGGVSVQGVYPVDASTRRLSGMLSKAGGVAIEPDIAQIRILRGQHVGTIWLQDLYDNTMADIALRAGDKIVVEEDRRAFTALGATGGQTQVDFVRREFSVLEAIAQVGGLNAALADPKGIFVFRDEPSYIANRVMNRNDLLEPQKIAYIIDLTQPAGMFTARDFQIRDGDTLYITEAPFANWQKIMAATLGSLNFAGSVGATTTAFSN